MGELLSKGHLGLCSITLKDLSAAEVADVVGRSELPAVEWAEVHAPAGQPGQLEAVREAALAAGVQGSSYGSYWRAAASDAVLVPGLVEAACTVGARRIRIWAGALGSADAEPEYWEAVIAATDGAARVAVDQGCELAFEFHGDSLTDTVEGTIRLLEQVRSPNLSTYWQPPVNASTEDAIAGLERLVDRVSAVHVFSWWPGTTRLPLVERSDLWAGVMDVLARHESTADLLLEFVPNDDPALVISEAAALRDFVRGVVR